LAITSINIVLLIPVSLQIILARFFRARAIVSVYKNKLIRLKIGVTIGFLKLDLLYAFFHNIWGCLLTRRGL